MPSRQTGGPRVSDAPSLLEAPVPLTRVVPKGPVKIAFWALRIYILIMLVLVAIGFSRGLH